MESNHGFTILSHKKEERLQKKKNVYVSIVIIIFYCIVTEAHQGPNTIFMGYE